MNMANRMKNFWVSSPDTSQHVQVEDEVSEEVVVEALELQVQEESLESRNHRRDELGGGRDARGKLCFHGSH